MTDSNGPAVKLDCVSKRLGWTWALQDIELEVARGTSLVVMGPNGAGKTTLLRLVAGLLRPTEGGGEVLEIPLRKGGAIRQRVGLLSARDHLYDDLTATENLQFAAWMAGQRTGEVRIRGALAKVGLHVESDRRVREFSTGMRRRLAFARLLLRPLDLVLLDEPYASLDAEGIRLVDDFVEEWRLGGRTVLLATHLRGAAVKQADRVAVLREGRLLRYCRPDELRPAKPAKEN